MTEAPRRNAPPFDPSEPSPPEEDRDRRRTGVMAWLLVAFMSVCLLFACSQLIGLRLTGDQAVVDTGSKMKADYTPWGYTTFGPINPTILLDILQQLKLTSALVPSVSGDCLIPGTCRTAEPRTEAPAATAAGPSTTPTVTLTPSPSPTMTLALTATSTATNVPTATITPSPTNTPTPTPLVYPVKLANPSRLDPLQSQTIAYSILVINYGSLPPADLTAVCDFLPSGLNYVPGSANRGGSIGPCPDGSGTAIVWNVSDSIPQGGFSRFTFEARSNHPAAGTTFTNTVRTIGGNFETAVNWKAVQAYTPTPAAIANNDTYWMDEDVSLVRSAPGVLGNDINGDSASVVATPANGGLVLSPDGSFTYSPSGDWNGSDGFAYQACASGGSCDNASVSITVNPVEDAPIAVDDTYSINEDQIGGLSVAPAGVLANDYDPDVGDLLWAYKLSDPNPSLGLVTGFWDDGSFNFSPAADAFGTASFSYQACDFGTPSPLRDCTSGTVTITINEVNDPPIAANDSAEVAEDDSVTIDVLANDIDGDPSPDPLTVQSVSDPPNGTVVNNGTDVTYAPDPNYRGPDGFTYVVSDGRGGSDTGTVTITVDPVNDIPQAVDDGGATFTTDEDTVLNVAAPGVLANDTGIGDTPLTLTVVSTPPAAEGSVSLNNDGSLTFTPAADFNGTTSFDYQVEDTPQAPETQESDTATVTITVNPVNDAPVAGDDGPYTLAEDSILDTSISLDPSLLANDSDIDTGDVLSVQPTPFATPSHGTVTLQAAGTFSYTPVSDYRGPDGFSYSVCDDGSPQLCDTAAVTLTITPVDDVPVAAADSYTTDEDTTLNAPAPGVLANDSGLGDTPLTLTVAATPPPAEGSVSLNNDGSFTFTPALNFNGTTSFDYRVQDTPQSPEIQQTDTATVTITVTAVNDAPVAVADSDSVNEDSSVTISVLSNDSDVDGTLDAGSVVVVSGPSNGTASPNPSGMIDYTPDPDYRGADSFSYRVDDNLGATSNAATVSVTVVPVDDVPNAVNDNASTDEDNSVTIIVLSNDTGLGDTPISVSVTSGPANGSTVVNGNNTITYTPGLNYNGPDSFDYQLTDTPQGAEIQQSDTATVTIAVNPVNDAPVAVDDIDSVSEDSSVNIDVVANDTDVDGTIDLTSVVVTSGPSNGSVVVNLDGTVDYTPDSDYRGSDSFTYTIDDNLGATSNTATVNVTVVPVDDSPAAAPDSFSTDEDTVLNVSSPGVLSNDSGLGDTPLTLTVTTAPPVSEGSVSLNDNGSFTFTPALNFNGSTSFEYTITDSSAGPAENVDTTTPATVTITVNSVNDAPVANSDSGSVDEDGSVNIDVASNDTDVDGTIDLTSVVVTSGPSNGSTVVNSDGTVDYTPDPDYRGSDSFTYTVDDNQGATSNAATVSVTIVPVDDQPVANPDSDSTDEDVAVTVNVLSNDTGLGDTPLSVAVTSGPSNGSAAVNGNNTITYTPDPDYNGPDSFDYQVTDTPQGSESQQSDTATVTITVNPVNDTPSAATDAYSTNEDTNLNVSAPGVLSNDSGLGDTPLSLSVVATPPPSEGSVSLSNDGSFTFTPALNFNGTTAFDYQVTDADSQTSQATVSIVVNSINDAPTAGDDSSTVLEDGSLTIDVLSNDGDIDGSLDVGTVQVASGPSHGAASPNPDGTIDYTPDADYRGSDSFTYTVDDNQGASSNAAAVSVSITPTNDTPVASADGYSTDEDVPLTVTVPGVLGNDSGLGDTPLTLTVVATPPPSEGSVALSDDGSFTFAPGADFNGTTTFEYTITDSGLLAGEVSDTSAPATVTITVNAVNDPPVAVNDPESPTVYAVDEDDPAGLTVPAPGVLGNDTDVDDTVPDDLTAVLDGGPANGSLTLNANGSFIYHPSADFNGTDTFTYFANDGSVNSDSAATVTITVNPTNDPPNAADDSFGPIDQGAPVTSSVVANDSDPDAGDAVDPTSVTITSAPAHGMAVPKSDGTVTYTHDGGADLTDSFGYRVCDSDPAPLCDTATVNVTIRQPQLTLDLSPDSDSAGPNTDVTFTASFWNDGPGTAYGTVVTASVSGGCTLRTANPIFTGDLAGSAAAFENVTVRTGSVGSSCQVTVSISSINGTSSEDASTLSVPSGGGGLLSILQSIFGGRNGGSELSTATPTLTLPTHTATPMLPPSSTPTLEVIITGMAEPTVEPPTISATPLIPSSTSSATPVSPSLTATELPVAATPLPAQSPTGPSQPGAATATPPPRPTATMAPAALNGSWLAASAPIEVAVGHNDLYPWHFSDWLHLVLARILG